MLIYGGSTVVAVLLARREGALVKKAIARYFYPGEEETATDAWTIISKRSYETFAVGMHRAFRVHPVRRVAEFLEGSVVKLDITQVYETWIPSSNLGRTTKTPA